MVGYQVHRSRSYILAKSIIVLLLLNSMQISGAQARIASMLSSAGDHPCQMTSMYRHENKGNPDSALQQSDGLCLHCQDASNFCPNNCHATSLIAVLLNDGADLKSAEPSVFYTNISYPSTHQQQPLQRPPQQ